MDFGRFLGGWSEGVVNDLFVFVVDFVVGGLLDGLVVGLVDRFGLDRVL